MEMEGWVSSENCKEKFSQVFLKKGWSSSGGVGVLIAGKGIDNAILVVRHSTRLTMLQLHEPEVQGEYQNLIKEHRADVIRTCVENAWNNLKNVLLSGVGKGCSKTKGGWVRHNQNLVVELMMSLKRKMVNGRSEN